MSRVVQVRVAIAIVGIFVWGYGVASDDARVRLVGIVLLVASLLLRFLPKQRGHDGDETPAT